MQVCSSSRRGAQLIDMDAEGRGTKGRKVKGKMGDEVFTRQVTACSGRLCGGLTRVRPARTARPVPTTPGPARGGICETRE